MAIKTIRISNFKSFRDSEIELGSLNVLIGANASGKSNFVEIFRFLRDIVTHGLDNAISMQGGVEYLRNTRIGSSRDFSLRVVSEQELRLFVRKDKRLIGAKTNEVIYEFAIEFRNEGGRFEISEDQLALKKTEFLELERREEEITEKEELGLGEIILSNVGEKPKYDLRLPKGVPIEEDDISPPFFREEVLPPRPLLLEFPHVIPFFPPFSQLFEDISIYDFDPRLSKEAVKITGKTELEENASNLAIVLKNILENKDDKRKFSNLTRDLLPFVDDWDVERFAAKSLLFKLREIYAPHLYLPAYLISDGTINITALIIALYFEEKPLIIIEEPERNIHPYLIAKVVEMLKEASEKKQIIVTTHNPEIVKYADLEDILLISRDKEGFSTISRPVEKEEVKTFLKNEIGIEELYIQNLLGI